MRTLFLLATFGGSLARAVRDGIPRAAYRVYRPSATPNIKCAVNVTVTKSAAGVIPKKRG